MATKSDFRAAQERIFSRPRPESRSEQDLLRKTEDDGVYPSPLNVKAIRIDRIVTDPNRPAPSSDDESLAALGQSLLAHGQIVPILVQYRSDGDVFVLVDGARRWRAAQQVGIQTLQAIIIGYQTEAGRLEQQAVLALHKRELAPADCAQLLDTYKAQHEPATWADVAHDLAISEAAVQERLDAPTPPPAAPAASPSDPLSQVNAAMDALVSALASLPARPGKTAELGKRLDALVARLAEQRTRLQKGKHKTEPDQETPVEGEGKPVDHMPTWE